MTAPLKALQHSNEEALLADIEGVNVIPLTTHMDDRGYLTEIARSAEAADPHGVVHKFGQVYLVGDLTKGTIRGFHKHAHLWDWFFINHGSAKFVLKDDRDDSATKGELMTVVTGARKPALVCVPPGVYHGWMALEDDTQMISVASEYYNSDEPDEVRIPADSFGDVWDIKGR
jgi:dTDP-4-dehydrorhamnose 3,5-epimerase